MAGNCRNDLSTRELEVLQLAAEGLTDKEIALRLAIAPSTASNHMAAIFTKLGAANRANAVAIAAARGLVRAPEAR